MTSHPVLAPGDQVHFGGAQYQVLSLSGTSVRLRSVEGTEQVVLARYLLSAPDFAVLGRGAARGRASRVARRAAQGGPGGRTGVGTPRRRGRDRTFRPAPPRARFRDPVSTRPPTPSANATG